MITILAIKRYSPTKDEITISGEDNCKICLVFNNTHSFKVGDEVVITLTRINADAPR